MRPPKPTNSTRSLNRTLSTFSQPILSTHTLSTLTLSLHLFTPPFHPTFSLHPLTLQVVEEEHRETARLLAATRAQLEEAAAAKLLADSVCDSLQARSVLHRQLALTHPLAIHSTDMPL